MRNRIFPPFSKVTIFVLSCCFVFCATGASFALEQRYDSIPEDDIHMLKGDLITIEVSAMTRLSVTNPDIADIVNADENEILIVAQEQGQTIMFIWDDKGKRSVTIYVSEEDLQQIQRRLKSLLKSAGIHSVNVKVNEEEGRIVLVGEVTEADKTVFDTITLPFDDFIINLTTEEKINDLIEINAQISEVNASSLKNLGFDWGSGETSELAVRYDENFPNLDGSFGDLFQIGNFSRVHALNVTLNLLEDKGEAKTLSRPKIVVKNGEEASFLVGGEIPIRTTTATNGATQENVQFKDYGISLTLTPTIKNEKIEIELNVESSDIDPSITAGSKGDVAFLTRTAQTTLFVDDKQTIVLAGFIRKTRSLSEKRVPYLASVPVFGMLFRSKSNPSADQDTELIISMTPTIISKNRKIIPGEYNDKSADMPKVASNQRTNPNYVSGVPKEMMPYVKAVQQKISESVRYPAEAKSYGWEGTVKLGMLILKDGTMAYALVKNSSGHEIFDEFAVEQARASAPFDPFPADVGLEELNITIPIVYSLDR